MDLVSKLFKGDRVIWVIFMFLCLISAIEVFSATSTLAYKSVTHWEPIARHGSFMLCGFVLVLLMHNLPYRFYTLLTLGAFISVVLLALLFVPGMAVKINGEPRWMNIFGITFQPSEIAKLSLVGYTAFIMSKRNWFNDQQMFWWIEGAALLICGLIFITNGSTAILLFSVVQMMAFFGQVSFARLAKFWGVIVAILALVIALLYFAPESAMENLPKSLERIKTMKARIERFFDPAPPVTMAAGKAVSIDDEDYQVVHGKIAIASGGIWGKFPGHGQQRDFLPQAFSDFIYAIIIEEMGIAGGLFVLFLYMALLIRVGMIARRCDKLFPKFLVLGCGLLLVVQALTNMAVAVDLIPVTGQPLPLVSRGGTSTIISCAYIGIILSVSRFGANMGNDDDTDALASDDNSVGIEPETDGHSSDNASASAENGTGATENGTGIINNEPNPLEAVAELKEETTTETKI